MNPLLIGGIVETVGKVADDLFTSDEERAKMAIEAQKAETDAYRAETERVAGQTEINKAEAQHASVFVSGGRPFIMWVCGFAMAYVSVIEPIARFVARVMFDYTGEFPTIDTDLTMQVLFGILGLGAYRSFEKVKNVASK